MSRLALLCAAVLVGSPMVSSAAAQNSGLREQLILHVLDTNVDGVISCEELAAFLNPVVITTLREQGVEPNQTSRVPPCGPRSKPGPAPADEPDRSPEKNYEEFFRELISGALNAATAVSASDDAVAAGEILELENAHLPMPLAGTFGDLLPTVDKPSGGGGSWIDALTHWIQVRQSFLDEAGIGKPAKLSWTDHGAGDETLDAGAASRVFQINAAVILNPPKEWTVSKSIHVRPVASFEADVESDAPTKDRVVTRIGFSSIIVRHDAAAPFSSHLIDWTFDYSTNRTGKATVLGTTFQYTPNYRQIGIGQYLGRGATIDFRWRPYVGVIWSDVKDADDVAAYKKLTTFTHEFVRLAGELRVTARGKITPEFTLWHGDRSVADGSVTHWQTRRSVEGRLVLSESKGVDRASLSLTLTDGRDSPDFLLEKRTVLALAVKF